MEQKDTAHIRKLLLAKRDEILSWLQQFEADWQAGGERDIELEEEAQKADLTSLYSRIDDGSAKALEEIDLALSRLATGSYGICESCKKQIALKRLQTLPAARLCRRCAEKFEDRKRRLTPATEIISLAELPQEYKNMNDEELKLTILEEFQNNGRVDVDELEVECRKGVIYLEGSIPSETQHRILLEILTDVMGFEVVIDHLRIDETAWQKEDRAQGAEPFPLSKDVEEIDEDIFESQEKQRPYMFPDKPPPEEG
jgi:DnaK suppressor protein